MTMDFFFWLYIIKWGLPGRAILTHKDLMIPMFTFFALLAALAAAAAC